MTSRGKLPLSKASSTGRLKLLSSNSASLNAKVETLVSSTHLNRSYDLFRLLTERASVKPLKLRVAETMLMSEGQECFLSTAQTGLVRTDREPG